MAPLPLRSRSSRINTENRTQTTLSKFLTRASSKLQAQQNARQQQQQQQPPQQQQQQQQQQQPRKSIIDSKSKIPENKILEGVVACLDVRTEDGDDVSQNFERALQSMGAKTRRTFSDSCTHLIFKNGSPATLKKALSKNVFIINLLWISRCKKEGRRLSEKEFIIERPQGLVLAGKKRRKSMEPSKVRALGSNDHLEPSTSSSSDASINDDLYESNQRLAEVRRKTIGIPSWKRQRMEDAGLVKRYTESFDNEESEDDIKRTTRLSLPISVEKMAAKHVIPSVNKSMPVAPSPEMKEHIKARFSFGKKVEDDTDTSKDLLPFVPLVANSTAMSTSGSTVTPLRRKRRLTGNTLPRQDNIPPSSASVVSTSTWNTSSESLPISIPKQRNVSRKPNIVFTSLTSDMRQKCKEAIESLGIYDIAAE
ncbi:hypothetical protein RMATCC62417_01325 [Rhizopus microsporus]|nr:hypothetical protein RMATCC62417_01325 [Rhizopus microsporus]